MQFQKRMRGHDRPEPARLPDPINAHARAHAARCGAARRSGGREGVHAARVHATTLEAASPGSRRIVGFPH